jgi:hypothetical protein
MQETHRRRITITSRFFRRLRLVVCVVPAVSQDDDTVVGRVKGHEMFFHFRH